MCDDDPNNKCAAAADDDDDEARYGRCNALDVVQLEVKVVPAVTDKNRTNAADGRMTIVGFLCRHFCTVNVCSRCFRVLDSR